MTAAQRRTNPVTEEALPLARAPCEEQPFVQACRPGSEIREQDGAVEDRRRRTSQDCPDAARTEPRSGNHRAVAAIVTHRVVASGPATMGGESS
jgi:hypothetical protein